MGIEIAEKSKETRVNQTSQHVKHTEFLFGFNGYGRNYSIFRNSGADKY